MTTMTKYAPLCHKLHNAETLYKCNDYQPADGGVIYAPWLVFFLSPGSSVVYKEAAHSELLKRNWKHVLNLLAPNDTYRGRTAPLTSKHCIL